jgi:hypothetical protein
MEYLLISTDSQENLNISNMSKVGEWHVTGFEATNSGARDRHFCTTEGIDSQYHEGIKKRKAHKSEFHYGKGLPVLN